MKRTGPQPKANIDLHLAVAETLIPQAPGLRWSHQEIADFVGCHRRLIDLTEKEAFRKIRRIMGACPEVADVFACPLQKARTSTRIRSTPCLA